MLPEFIYFDLGNVICYFDRAREVRQVAQVSGVAEEKVREILLGSDGLLWQFERGELNEQQFYEAFCTATNSRPEISALLQADADIFMLNSGLLPLVAHLEDAQIPLGVLSNISATHWRLVIDGRFAILPGPFRKRILSYEVGSTKPDEKIFQQAIEAAGVPAQRILYIDDLPKNVETARKLGIDAVHYTTTDALVRELIERKVRCNY